MAMASLEPVVQVIWPMVNMRPLRVAMEPEVMTVLFVATVDEIRLTVYLGVCPR